MDRSARIEVCRVTAWTSAGIFTSLSTVNSTSTYPVLGVTLLTLPTFMPSTATLLVGYSPAALSNWAVMVMVSRRSLITDQPYRPATRAPTAASTARIVKPR